jgi:protein-disulfide isomerase
MDSTKSTPLFNIPIAIIIAGAIVAGAIIWTKRPAPATNANSAQPEQVTISIRPVSSNDHILGNPNAPIKIVEYSDTACPFCKIFHPIMKSLMDSYGKTGNVAWVYRHFPLDTPDINGNVLHKNAGHEAQALECAAEIGGNDKFWTFTNRLYEITPSVTGATPNGLDQSELPVIAKFAGIDVAQFNTCLASGRTKAQVDADRTDGINAGISGTPSSVIVLSKAVSTSVKEQIMKVFEPYKNLQTNTYPIQFSSDNRMIAINGALPLEVMEATVEMLYTK